jgi:hypothetical protein
MLQIVFDQNPKLGSLEDFRNNVTITADFTGGTPTTVTIKPKNNGIYLYGTESPYEVICTPMTKEAYKAIPYNWIEVDGSTIKGLSSQAVTGGDYNTLDLTIIPGCTAIADNAFSPEKKPTDVNIHYFGDVYPTNYENSTRNPSHRDGPIKYLKLPDSITSIGIHAFRQCYSFNSTLILPKEITTLGTGFPFHFSGFTGISINENYKNYNMDNYKPF